MHAQTLKEITLYLRDDLVMVEKIIQSSLKSEVLLINDVVLNLINSGGKKIRPIFTIASAKLCNFSFDAQYLAYLSAAIELIHNATLLHDDVVDNNDTRRGMSNTKRIWGNQISVLVGDLLFSVAFKLLVKCKDIEALSAVSDVAFLLSEGEIKQLGNTGIIISEEEYIQTISLKTASLFAVSCSISAIVAKDIGLKKILYDFGMNLGIAFQIIDDVLDYDYSSNSGKAIGNDFYTSKVTMPIILANCLADTEEKQFWKDCFSSPNTKNLNTAIMYMQKNDIFAKCINKAEFYINNCIKLLSNFANSEIKTILEKTLKFTIQRNF